jgi:Uma2 family endonuclease
MLIDSNFNKLTYEHYVCFPDDGQRHEIVDGDHYVNPAPNLRHQTISRRLQHQLYSQIELEDLGCVFYSPVDVQLTEFDIVQPDLVVVLKDCEQILTQTKIDGAPNLIIEILSQRTARYDRTLKKKLYQRAGVPEYWIVDPDEQTIEQFVLENRRYQQRTTGDEITLSILDDVSIKTQGLWD